MSQISTEQVRHIAKLARLRLRDEEIMRFTEELGSILGYVDMLKEVDITGVEPTEQVTGMSTILRDDVLRSCTVSPDALLATSALPLVQHQIQTPAAHG